MLLILGWVFILGTVVGSFLNVCISRIPEKKSVISPPSHCPQCGMKLRWYQNIPIVSYLALRGRCAGCGLRIPLRYLLVEVSTGVLFLKVFLLFGMQWATVLFWVFSALLIVVTFIDLDHQIIPDVLSYPGIVVGLAGSYLVPWLSFRNAVIGVLLGGGILYLIAVGYQLIAKREGMGGGDIKLLGMLGAFLGWKAIFPIILIASLLGTAVGVPWMLLRRKEATVAIPFGPFLAAAGLVFLFWGPQIVYWYLSLFHV